MRPTPFVPVVATVTRGRLALAALLAASSASCLSVDFDPPSVVNGVRILASRANKPFAKPGDTVEIEVLAHDGRADRTRPMQIYWIPTACFNPPRDLYYLCFAQFAGRQTAAQGAGAEPALPLQPGLDLTALLPKGPKFSITLPKDVVSSHPPSPGALSPYGLGIVFNIACAGRVKLEELSDNPQSVPLGCYDDAGKKLGADDFVIGFSRVYAYDDKTNANPVIDGLTFDGKPLGPEGIVVDRCTKEKFKECETKKLGALVPDASWEPNDLSKGSDGQAVREQLWATFHSTIGRFDNELRLLFDPQAGRVGESENELRIPKEPGAGLVWVIVRDNRGGAAWREIPITVK